MLILEFRCLTGHWHATPWGHHVNEGVVEWPPSPWRLLRSLLATWYHKAQEEVSPDTIKSLLELLASEQPSFSLPPASAAHSRHYMPTYKGSTTKVFDTFLNLSEDDVVRCVWPKLSLTAEQHQALALVLENLGYLGRAESWVEAKLAQSPTETEHWKLNAFPLDSSRHTGSDEIVRLLSPMEPQMYSTWRDDMLEQKQIQALEAKRNKDRTKKKDPTKTKLIKKELQKIESSLPVDIFAALHAETGDLRKAGWSQPPGSQWVEYTRPRDAFARQPSQKQHRTIQELPTVARFAVSSAALPRLIDALPLAEKIRLSLLKISDGHPVFLGREGDTPLRGHCHTHILPESNGNFGRITHVTMYARMGFDSEARQALGKLHKVWGHGGHDVRLILFGVGQPKDFAGSNRDAGQSLLLETSKRWISRTPFVPTRHAKRYKDGRPKCDATGLQIDGPEYQLRDLLKKAGLPEPIRVTMVDSTNLSGREVRWIEFNILRKDGGGRRSSNRGYGFEIEFEEPIEGPIILGYGAHFGLGSFEFIPE